MARVRLPQAVINAYGHDVIKEVGPRATVTVNTRNDGLATIYADETSATTLSNPTQADGFGWIEGWVDEGSYDLTVTAIGLPTFPSQRFEAARGDGGGSVTTGGTYVGLRGLAPDPPLFPPTNDTVIQTLFAAGHGFTKTFGTGSIADDTAIFQFGLQSLRITTLGDASGTNARKTGMAALDATGKYLAVTIRVDRPDLLTGLELYVGTGGFTNFSVCEWIEPTTNVGSPYLVPNRWETVLIPWDSIVATGGTGATRSSLDSFQIRAQDTGTGTGVNVWVNKISTVAQPSTAVLSYTCDDGYLAQSTIAKPYMDKYGHKATFAPIVNLTGGNYMTVAQWKALYEAGWDAAVHAYDVNIHNNYANQTDAVIEADVSAAKAYMRANGLGHVDNFIIPQGQITSQSRIDIWRRYFALARSSYQKIHETYPPARTIGMRCVAVNSSTTAVAINAIIDNAIANNQWIILEIHNIAAADPADGSVWVSTAMFQAIVDHVNSSGIKVKTLRDVARSGLT